MQLRGKAEVANRNEVLERFPIIEPVEFSMNVVNSPVLLRVHSCSAFFAVHGTIIELIMIPFIIEKRLLISKMTSIFSLV